METLVRNLNLKDLIAFLLKPSKKMETKFQHFRFFFRKPFVHIPIVLVNKRLNMDYVKILIKIEN